MIVSRVLKQLEVRGTTMETLIWMGFLALLFLTGVGVVIWRLIRKRRRQMRGPPTNTWA